jgi:mRNA interferase YafQ
MTTLSVPINAELEKFIDNMVKDGRAANKADVVRKALRRMSEEEAVQAILISQQEIREGKILRGDLEDLLKKI